MSSLKVELDRVSSAFRLEFQIRGAMNAVLQLVKTLPNKEQAVVVTHSSGNHAQALALAARITGLQAHIAMPHNAPEVKKAAVRGYGAHVKECGISHKVRKQNWVTELQPRHIRYPWGMYVVIKVTGMCAPRAPSCDSNQAHSTRCSPQMQPT